MPSTKSQMRAAGRELRLRREGKVSKESERGVRPFGAMSTDNLRKFAGHPVPAQQRRAAVNELLLREAGGAADPTRPFGKASRRDVEFFASATDDEIRQMNDKRLR